MKIIIEGCDGTGKSTLAKKLAKHYNLDVVHMTNKDPKDFNFYKETMRKENVVFDRHFMGEMIYPNIFKRPGELSEKQYKDLLYLAKTNYVVILVLVANKSIIETRLKDKNEHEFIINQIKKIQSNYIDLAGACFLPVIDTLETPFEEIISYINEVGDTHVE